MDFILFAFSSGKYDIYGVVAVVSVVTVSEFYYMQSFIHVVFFRSI